MSLAVELYDEIQLLAEKVHDVSSKWTLLPELQIAITTITDYPPEDCLSRGLSSAQ